MLYWLRLDSTASIFQILRFSSVSSLQLFSLSWLELECFFFVPGPLLLEHTSFRVADVFLEKRAHTDSLSHHDMFPMERIWLFPISSVFLKPQWASGSCFFQVLIIHILVMTGDFSVSYDLYIARRFSSVNL